MEEPFTMELGLSPIVATAIHDGHNTRQELGEYFNLNEAERLREEDPFTAKWVLFTDNRIVFHQSRFETDVNRPPEKAIYRQPEDAWGLQVWKKQVPAVVFDRSLALYNQFYRQVKNYFDKLFEMHEKIVVYDIHSYNYKREGQNQEANPAENPEINLGTKNLNNERWQPLVEALQNSFSAFDYAGRTLDVRENIKFKGGYFGQWLYENYGNKICPVSIEFKKFFMNEWTGLPFTADIQRIQSLLAASRQPVMDALRRVKI